MVNLAVTLGISLMVDLTVTIQAERILYSPMATPSLLMMTLIKMCIKQRPSTCGKSGKSAQPTTGEIAGGGSSRDLPAAATILPMLALELPLQRVERKRV